MHKVQHILYMYFLTTEDYI